MKKLFFIGVCFIIVTAVQAQIKPAEQGVVYGNVTEKGTPINVTDLENNLKKNKYEGKITGKVVEVCQAMGCWIKLEKEDGTTLMVKSKDHGFFMPLDIVGKKVIVEGDASVKEISEKMRKHYAEDAGKSKEEIEKIKGSTKEVFFNAYGVKVL